MARNVPAHEAPIALYQSDGCRVRIGLHANALQRAKLTWRAAQRGLRLLDAEDFFPRSETDGQLFAAMRLEIKFEELRRFFSVRLVVETPDILLGGMAVFEGHAIGLAPIDFRGLLQERERLQTKRVGLLVLLCRVHKQSP